MTSGAAATRDWYQCNLCHETHTDDDRSCHPFDSQRDYSGGPIPRGQPVKYKTERPEG